MSKTKPLSADEISRLEALIGYEFKEYEYEYEYEYVGPRRRLAAVVPESAGRYYDIGSLALCPLILLKAAGVLCIWPVAREGGRPQHFWAWYQPIDVKTSTAGSIRYSKRLRCDMAYNVEPCQCGLQDHLGIKVLTDTLQAEPILIVLSERDMHPRRFPSNEMRARLYSCTQIGLPLHGHGTMASMAGSN